MNRHVTAGTSGEDGGTQPPRLPETVDHKPRAVKDLTRQALGGMFWTFSGTGVQVLFQLLVLMILARLLTPAEFGLMGAAMVVVSLSQIVSQVGVGPAIIQRRELGPTHVRVAVTLSAALGVLLGALVWLGAPAIAAFYRIPEVEPVLRGVAFLFPLDGLNTVAKSLLSRQLQFRLLVALEVSSYIVGYAVVGVVLAWQGFGVWALVLANLSQVTLRMISMYLATKHPVRPSLDIRAAQELLSFGFGHSLAQIGTLLSQQGDNLVVGRWLGAAALGIYGRAYSLMVMPGSAFGRIINRVLFPVMSQVQDERDRLARGYERGLAIVALIALPISASLWLIAPEFILVLLGPGWTEVVLPFRLFTISLLFHMSSKISDACTKAAGAVYARAVLQGLFAALVIMGAIIGQRWGIGGVAVAVSIALAVNWLAMGALSRRVTGLSWARFGRAQLPGVLMAMAVGAGVGLGATAARAAQLSSILVVLVSAVSAAAVILAAVRQLPGLFLGPHGTWALHRVLELVREKVRHMRRLSAASRRTGLAKADSQ